jgi:hypothetical protein
LKKRTKKTFTHLDPSGGDAWAHALKPANGEKFFWFFFFRACLELTDSQDNGLDDSSFGWNAKY